MQYSNALYRLLRKIVFADPALGPVYMLKADVSDGFYRIRIRPEDAPKLGLISLSCIDEEPMMDIPLTFHMGGNPPPYSV